MYKDMTKETLYFVGGLFPREREDEIRRLTKSGLQSAANNLQWKFVHGYDLCLGEDNVHLLNSEYIGSFPKRYGGVLIPRYTFRHAKGESSDVGAGFVNLPVLKEFSRASRLKAELRRINREEDERLYFVGYAATYPIVTALKFAKKLFPDSVCCLIVPDLPQYMELGKNGAGLLRRIKNHVVSCGMRGMVVEGIADVSGAELARIPNASLPARYILYTGTLQYRYGIGDLLSAFKHIDDGDVGLVICGDGEAVEEIQKMQSEDSRVRYLGVLTTEEVAILRSGATVLVNPRKNEVQLPFEDDGIPRVRCSHGCVQT